MDTLKILEILMKTDWSKLSKYTPADAASEIASLIKKDYFEWEFVEWCIINVVKNRFGRYVLIEGKESFITLNEVYEHWLTEVKSKRP